MPHATLPKPAVTYAISISKLVSRPRISIGLVTRRSKYTAPPALPPLFAANSVVKGFPLAVNTVLVSAIPLKQALPTTSVTSQLNWLEAYV